MDDTQHGYNDRMAGYYDKWYRYNRLDEGAAYDRGCVNAVNSVGCPANCVIIPS